MAKANRETERAHRTSHLGASPIIARVAYGDEGTLHGFGQVEIEGKRYGADVVIERGQVRRRHKGPSKPYRDRFGHTPLSGAEAIPWGGPRLIVGTGADGLQPIMPEVYEIGRRRNVEIVVLPTESACRVIADLKRTDVNAVLHVTC